MSVESSSQTTSAHASLPMNMHTYRSGQGRPAGQRVFVVWSLVEIGAAASLPRSGRTAGDRYKSYATAPCADVDVDVGFGALRVMISARSGTQIMLFSEPAMGRSQR